MNQWMTAEEGTPCYRRVKIFSPIIFAALYADAPAIILCNELFFSRCVLLEIKYIYTNLRSIELSCPTYSTPAYNLPKHVLYK